MLSRKLRRSPKSTVGRHGLALLELVVAMAILAGLAAILLPMFPCRPTRAHTSIDMTNLSGINKAIQLYAGTQYTAGPAVCLIVPESRAHNTLTNLPSKREAETPPPCLTFRSGRVPSPTSRHSCSNYRGLSRSVMSCEVFGYGTHGLQALRSGVFGRCGGVRAAYAVSGKCSCSRICHAW